MHKTLNQRLFDFGIVWNTKTISTLLILLVLPNILGLINLGTIYGFKIHFFQLAIFLAASIYGRKGGLLSGFVGSIYSALIMNNIYIIIFNMILGYFAGLFIEKKMNIVLAILLAFIVQLPILVLGDLYLVGLKAVMIQQLVIALAISNLIWALVTLLSVKLIKRLITR